MVFNKILLIAIHCPSNNINTERSPLNYIEFKHRKQAKNRQWQLY